MHGLLRFSGMQICSLLLLLIFIISCNGHDKTPLPKDSASEPQQIPARQAGMNTAVGDPSFVKAKDTISTHGPRSITRNILQDRNGNYWFATWEGIISYDGKRFTNVTLKEGLRHFHVFSVLEDETGTLWFGMIGGGVYRYDGTSFTLFTMTEGLANNIVTCMLEDMSGNIWFGTRAGASRFDGKTFTNFTTQDGLRSNAINSMVQDKFGKIWFGTMNGVNHYDGQSFTHFTNEKGLPFYSVNSIIEDKTGNIWIGSQDGLCRYDGKSLAILSTNATNYIFEDKTGNLWLSGGKINVNSPDMTLSRYDGKSFTRIKSDNQIFGITGDKTGNIWFGTVNGACRYNGKSFTCFLE